MGIVLNEHISAEESIHMRSLGKKPSETLRRVARYYIDESGDCCNKIDIRHKLDAFMLQCDPMASLPKWSEVLDFATDYAFKHKAVQIESITITDKEMEKIASLEKRQLKRLAFTLLCLSKYWNITNPTNDNWVNNKDNEIMAFANINTSIKRQCLLYSELKEKGFIQFSKKIDNTHVRVCFAEDGETAMVITDLRNLGYQYLKHYGEPYFECANCGITTKISSSKSAMESGANKVGRKQKYCKDCAIAVSTQQKVNYVMRRKLSTFLS